jgi:ribosome-binding protein aMBF1 (putative translation factor)
MMEQGKKSNIVYDPNQLIDALIRHLGLKSDGALSRKLKVAKSVIRKIRHGQLPIGASMLMWMHEATGISIDELRALMGDRRSKFRLNVARIG